MIRLHSITLVRAQTQDAQDTMLEAIVDEYRKIFPDHQIVHLGDRLEPLLVDLIDDPACPDTLAVIRAATWWQLMRIATYVRPQGTGATHVQYLIGRPTDLAVPEPIAQISNTVWVEP